MIIVSSLWDFTTSWLTPTSPFVILSLVIAIIAVTSRLSGNSAPKPHGHGHELNHQYYASETFNSAPQLTRSPSLLDRVKSINFSLYKFDDVNGDAGDGYFPNSPKLQRAPSLLERVTSFNFSLYRSQQPDPEPALNVVEPDPDDQEDEPRLTMKRSKSSEGPATAAATEEEKEEKMRKSKSEKTASYSSRETPEMVEKRRPQTAKVEKATAASRESPEKVEERRPQTARIEKTASFSNDEEINVKADDFINRFKQQLRLQRLDSILRYKEMINRGSAKQD